MSNHTAVDCLNCEDEGPAARYAEDAKRQAKAEHWWYVEWEEPRHQGSRFLVRRSGWLCPRCQPRREQSYALRELVEEAAR